MANLLTLDISIHKLTEIALDLNTNDSWLDWSGVEQLSDSSRLHVIIM